MTPWLARVRRRMLSAAAALTMLAAGAALASMVSASAQATAGSAPRLRAVVSPITELSTTCAGQNAEIEQAADPARGYVYEEWMACSNNTGFSIDVAASSNGGLTFGRPLRLADSLGAWDPSIAVAPNGTVYAAFMNSNREHIFPVVEASANHGRSFPRITRLVPQQAGNWGDRDFIAVGPAGTLYLTWDYGPKASEIRVLCPPGGSCSYAAGDLNIVVQKSANGGRTWGRMVHVSPDFPTGGGVSAPLLVLPNGRIYVDYLAFRMTGPKKLDLTTAHGYVTSSATGASTWSRPVRLGPAWLTVAHTEWWIDGDISADAGGTLYATWDSQVGRHDIGWLSYSRDRGRTWSAPRRVTPDTDDATHIVEVAGGSRGIAYVGWLADNAPQGYALYVRPFSVARGWLSGPIRVSRQFGNKGTWPGDTFGISAEPALRSGLLAGWPRIVVSWGSAVGTATSEDRAAVVSFDLP